MDKGSWKRKTKKRMQCGLSLSPHNQENGWYVDSGCSKHMTRNKRNVLSLKENDRGNNFTFGNNALTRIKGKGIVSLDQKTTAQNLLHVEVLKHNMLSFS